MNIMKTDNTDFHSCNFFTLIKTSTVFCSDVLEILKLPDNTLLVLVFQIYYLFGKKKVTILFFFSQTWPLVYTLV